VCIKTGFPTYRDIIKRNDRSMTLKFQGMIVIPSITKIRWLLYIDIQPKLLNEDKNFDWFVHQITTRYETEQEDLASGRTEGGGGNGMTTTAFADPGATAAAGMQTPARECESPEEGRREAGRPYLSILIPILALIPRTNYLLIL
jgi:hypothetical protein